jgi:hypothetical protein
MCTTARALVKAEATSFVCAPRSLTASRPATGIVRPTLPRPPHPVPTFVTMANAPREEQDGGSYQADLGKMRSGIFCGRRLDGGEQLDPVQEISGWAQRPRKAFGGIKAADAV